MSELDQDLIQQSIDDNTGGESTDPAIPGYANHEMAEGNHSEDDPGAGAASSLCVSSDFPPPPSLPPSSLKRN
jgi:hypothetical protein